ncbi:MAG: hypothetical protein GY775_09645 [Candidatus Scalindua sp.]|nr:hypothetical protein [Candidatus Scalindua sp.]
MYSELIQKIASDAVIDTAYEWLCKRRRIISTMTRSGIFVSGGLSSNHIYKRDYLEENIPSVHKL